MFGFRGNKTAASSSLQTTGGSTSTTLPGRRNGSSTTTGTTTTTKMTTTVIVNVDKEDRYHRRLQLAFTDDTDSATHPSHTERSDEDHDAIEQQPQQQHEESSRKSINQLNELIRPAEGSTGDQDGAYSYPDDRDNEDQVDDDDEDASSTVSTRDNLDVDSVMSGMIGEFDEHDDSCCDMIAVMRCSGSDELADEKKRVEDQAVEAPDQNDAKNGPEKARCKSYLLERTKHEDTFQNESVIDKTSFKAISRFSSNEWQAAFEKHWQKQDEIILLHASLATRMAVLLDEQEQRTMVLQDQHLMEPMHEKDSAKRLAGSTLEGEAPLPADETTQLQPKDEGIPETETTGLTAPSAAHLDLATRPTLTPLVACPDNSTDASCADSYSSPMHGRRSQLALCESSLALLAEQHQAVGQAMQQVLRGMMDALKQEMTQRRLLERQLQSARESATHYRLLSRGVTVQAKPNTMANHYSNMISPRFSGGISTTSSSAGSSLPATAVPQVTLTPSQSSVSGQKQRTSATGIVYGQSARPSLTRQGSTGSLAMGTAITAAMTSHSSSIHTMSPSPEKISNNKNSNHHHHNVTTAATTSTPVSTTATTLDGTTTPTTVTAAAVVAASSLLSSPTRQGDKSRSGGGVARPPRQRPVQQLHRNPDKPPVAEIEFCWTTVDISQLTASGDTGAAAEQDENTSDTSANASPARDVVNRNMRLLL